MIRKHQGSERRESASAPQRVLTYLQNHPLSAPAPLFRIVKDCWIHRREWLSYPVLFGIFIPLACFDICLEGYHRLTFSLLKIPYVSRTRFIRIDRHRLPYLSWSQKIACSYCGYANGLLQYAAQIAGQTEAFFCPIKHQQTRVFSPPPHHLHFAQYGDVQGYQQRVRDFRNTGTPSFKSMDTQSESTNLRIEGTLENPTPRSPSKT